MPKLTDKVAIITGGASGQGEAIARLFVAEGAQVLIGDINDAAGSQLAQELGEQALYRRLDVAEADDWARAVEATISSFGRIDILVNNAALFRAKAFLDTTVADWEAHNRVNQLGIFLGMQAVARHMIRAGGGSIINTSSNVALRAVPGMFAYSASKWGVRGMTKAAAVELAPYNVRVNTVMPGITDTPMFRSMGPEQCAEGEKLIPLGRCGQPQDIARTMLHLASDDGAYFAGAELVVDGAMFA